MGMSKKLNVIPFYTILVVFAMCVPSVEDPVSKNTCDWNCSAQSGDIDSKELEGKISHGDLIKLEITGKKRVHPSCGSANDTLDLNNKTEDAELWFKMAPTSMGKIAFLSSTILEEIFTGRIFFKSSKAMNVSCIFKPKTKSTINHSSLFAFHVARSVMYFVKEMANYSKRDVYFLTLIRMEKQTRITFDKSSLETSCQVDAPYDEWKLTVNDTWKVVSVLIAICIALCAPVTLLTFRPSKVIVQLTHETRENSKGARSPVQGDDVNVKPLKLSIEETGDSTLKDGKKKQAVENSHLTQDLECHTGEIAGSDDGRGENGSRTSVTVVEIRETSDHRSSRMEDQIVSDGGNRNCIPMIIVGRGPSPVSIGSWIGNKLFLSSNGNQCHKLKMLVKFIIISFLPILLLTVFGDLLVILLNIDQEKALDLPNHHLTALVFKVDHPGLIFLAVFSFASYALRSFFVYGKISECSIWKSCFVHSRHPLVFYRLRCLFCPCTECKNSPLQCPKQIEVPDNILHNFEELPAIFVKYCSLLQTWKTVKWVVFTIVILITLGVLRAFLLIVVICIVLLPFTPLVDILLSSPLVCLCHGRMRAFKDRRLWFKCLEFILTFFSLTWLVFYSIRGAVVVEIAIAGFLNMLYHHPKKHLLSATIVGLEFHYAFRSYSCFTARYLKLVEKLFNSYSEKYKELEEKGEASKFPNFKQGKHKKLIPTDLFECACEHESIKIPVRNSVAMMLLKTVVPLLVSVFVHPLIHLPRPDSASIGTAVVTLLMFYGYFDNYINTETPKYTEGDIDTVVDEYLKKQQ